MDAEFRMEKIIAGQGKYTWNIVAKCGSNNKIVCHFAVR
jgi:hypothetical protein